MRFAAAEAVVRAVLYEGFALYPYRASSVKNRHRWMFGTLAPPGGVDVSAMRTECLISGGPTTLIEVRVQFLHPVELDAGEGPGCTPCNVGREPQFVEVAPRQVSLRERPLADLLEVSETRFAFDGDTANLPPRSRVHEISGRVTASAAAVGAGAYRVHVSVENTTASRAGVDDAWVSFASTHILLGSAGGQFCSLSDPPAPLVEASAACRNVGTWPTLLSRDLVLSSPIILPDFPAIAPESVGDLFDATEIDEILTLRLLTLAESEMDEIRRCGGAPAALLDRTLALGTSDLARLHGALRGTVASELRPGDRVTLAPRRRADVFDIALAGRSATVVSIEEDFEGQRYATVTVDDDPGQDLGRTGQPGHRFFFHLDEVERVG